MSGTPLTSVKGVGKVLAGKFSHLGIHTIEELLEYYPKRYTDFSNITQISTMRPGLVTLKVTIKHAKGRYARRGLHITEAIASDDTGSVKLVWFNQPYRAQSIDESVSYLVSGDFGLKGQQLSISNPSLEKEDEVQVHTGRIVPTYRETKGLTSITIRKILKQCFHYFELVPETLPEWMLQNYQLLSRNQAVQTMHFPESIDALQIAQRRLGFEEVFELTLAAALNKRELMKDVSIAIPFDETYAQAFTAALPFALTNAQRAAAWQILQDMNATQAMNRLLEGDVGSGKTVVACMASVMAVRQGFQVAVMAPTEILARQLAETFSTILKPLGMHNDICLLVGSMKLSQKSTIINKLKNKEVHIVVGTHALIQDTVALHTLGLVIIDEQHRFGVQQRKALQKKAGHMPHVLSMTATPIPRSLALTLYGELDISVIDQKPVGRQPVITKICSPNSRNIYENHIDDVIDKGEQAFIVCPLIDESAVVAARSVEQVYKDIATNRFKHRRVALLHGKMKPAEKDNVMQEFVEGEIDILVATTVVEVGVNIPNASIMVIEGADRFGLAQLHQLRGRVGRGGQQAYCYLVTVESSAPSKRLRALEMEDNGFKLAEIDLALRGPGAIYGATQHGELDLRIAKLTDVKLISEARQAANEFIDHKENLINYKYIFERVKKYRAVTNLN